jgi:hypothetical protein
MISIPSPHELSATKGQYPIDHEHAVSLLVENLRSHIFQTACDGRELLFRRFEMLGAARSNDLRVRYFSKEHAKGTHIPESAMTTDPWDVIRSIKRHMLHPNHQRMEERRT